MVRFGMDVWKEIAESTKIEFCIPHLSDILPI